jgi:NADH-quinone oxidoreductase subunit N
MMVAVFSLAGIPPFAGFFSKFFILAASASTGEYVLVFIALLNTVVSLYYYLLIVKAMFINAPEESPVGRVGMDAYHRLSLLLCVAGVLCVGVFSGVFDYILQRVNG